LLFSWFRGYYIKDILRIISLHQSDVTIDLSTNRMEVHNNYFRTMESYFTRNRPEYNDGRKNKKSQGFILVTNPFSYLHGDGVADVNIKELISFHTSHGKSITMTLLFSQKEDLDCITTDESTSGKCIYGETKGRWKVGLMEVSFVCEPKVLDLY
jgi:glucose-1-phosphate cytidylyltransferase